MYISIYSFIHHHHVSLLYSLSDTQLACLSSVRLCFLFSTLELFVRWVKEGLYDFNSLPIALKVHLNEEDSTLLEQLPDSFSSTSSQLLAELKRLIDALHHIEARLIKEVNKQAQVRMINELTDGIIVNQYGHNSCCLRNHYLDSCKVYVQY